MTLWTIPLSGSCVHGILQARIHGGFPFPFPGDIPDLKIDPESPALQADSLPTKSSEKSHPSLVVNLIHHSWHFLDVHIWRIFEWVYPNIEHMLTCGQIVAYILLFSSCKIRDYLPNTEKFGVETFSTMRKIRHILLLFPPGIPGHRNVFSHPGLLPCHWVFYNLIYKKRT